MIESGSVAVFVSQLQSGSLQGSRQYLFTAEVGEALFGFPTSFSDSSIFESTNVLCILAVPLTDSTLLHFHRSEFDRNSFPSSTVTAWFKQLSSVFHLLRLKVRWQQFSNFGFQFAKELSGVS
ncbi:hypothetical protein [Scytonema sp. NUACC26]|uniref:hypothetical protein n=1 Tax=Scytonema sp. NUACC26 TaxID=3140176 RepID=UPI0034DB7F4D